MSLSVLLSPVSYHPRTLSSSARQWVCLVLRNHRRMRRWIWFAGPFSSQREVKTHAMHNKLRFLRYTFSFKSTNQPENQEYYRQLSHHANSIKIDLQRILQYIYRGFPNIRFPKIICPTSSKAPSCGWLVGDLLSPSLIRCALIPARRKSCQSSRIYFLLELARISTY